jgi:lipopolysaccharide export system permease protein
MILYRYILKAHAGPFFFALAIVVFLFLFQFLMKSLDQLIGKGLSIWIIIQLISLNLAWMLTLAVPMAVLVATLMAFGNFAANNEITSAKAGGISLMKLMIPVILISGILCYLMVRFNNDVLPEANHKARVLFSDITRTKPTLILEPGKFSEDIGGARILVNKTFPNSNNIEGIFIYDNSRGNYKNLFTAKTGDIGFSSDLKNMILNLNNGEIHQYNLQDPQNKYRKVEFEKHRMILPAENFGFQESGESSLIRGDRELPAETMRNIADSLQLVLNRADSSFAARVINEIKIVASLNYKDTVFKQYVPDAKDSALTPEFYAVKNKTFDSLNSVAKRIFGLVQSGKSHQTYKQDASKQIDSYLVEIYKKYSIPFACIVFALIGAPLGYRVRKGGFGIAAGFSLLFFLLYWASLIGGEKLADRGLLSPFMGMWIANILLGLLGLYLMFKSS